MQTTTQELARAIAAGMRASFTDADERIQQLTDLIGDIGPALADGDNSRQADLLDALTIELDEISG